MLSPEANHGDDGFIFISHAPQDSQRIQPIISRMQQDGFRLCCPDSADPSEDADNLIAARISTCGYFIAFLSANYLSSNECKDELMYARDQGKHQLLIYLEDVELPSGMAMRMGRNQAIFHNRYRSSADFFAKLYEAQNITNFSQGISIPAQQETKQAATTLQKRRRSASLWGFGIVLILAVAATCIFLFSQKGPAEDTSGSTGEPVETSTAPTVPVDEDLLLDNEQVTIRHLGLTDGSDGAALSLSVENKTVEGLYLAIDECFVNGIQHTTEFLVYIPAGQSGRADLLISKEFLSTHTISFSNISVIDCTVLNKAPGSNTASELGRFMYYPNGKENSQLASYEPTEEDIILADTPEYLIAYRNSYYDEAQDTWYLPFIFVNRTDDSLMFTTEGETVNRFVLDSGWSQTVASHRTVQSTLTLDAIHWKLSGYEQVLAYTGTLLTYSGSAYEAPILTQSVCVYPEGDEAGTQLPPRELTKKELIYEDESFILGYLGMWDDGSGVLKDVLYIRNLTDSQQTLDLLVQMNDQSSSEFSDTIVLESSGGSLISWDRNNAATSATITLERWHQKYYRYETFGPFTISLADQ